MSAYQIVKKEVPTFYFIGVTTGKSSIMKVFPLWMDVLGRPEVIMEGIDHRIHDAAGGVSGQRGPNKKRSIIAGGLGHHPQNGSVCSCHRYVRLL